MDLVTPLLTGRAGSLLSSPLERTSTAPHWYQCGAHEESFLFCLDPVVVLDFQWRLYADGLHLHLVSMSEQGHFWKKIVATS